MFVNLGIKGDEGPKGYPGLKGKSGIPGMCEPNYVKFILKFTILIYYTKYIYIYMIYLYILVLLILTNDVKYNKCNKLSFNK